MVFTEMGDEFSSSSLLTKEELEFMLLMKLKSGKSTSSSYAEISDVLEKHKMLYVPVIHEESNVQNIQGLSSHDSSSSLESSGNDSTGTRESLVTSHDSYKSVLEEEQQQAREMLTDENPNRFCLFPIQYPDIYEFYKLHQRTMWTAEEIDFSLDKKDWKFKLTEDERYFIEHILAFFAGSDGIVLENLVTNFCREIQVPEARCFYAFQSMIEVVHSEVYSLMIDTLVDSVERKTKLFHAIQNIPCVQQKAEWSLKWINPKNSLATRLLAFVIVEGLFFSGSFCAIFWLKERGLMVHSLGKSNEWIARDEGLHQNFGIHLYTKYIRHRLTEETAHVMMRNAVAIESQFLTESLPVRLIGMNHGLMLQYIQFVADRILLQLGYQKLYHVTNPFPFMEKIGLDGKTNFFEQRVSEYSMNHENKLDASTFSFDECVDDDF